MGQIDLGTTDARVSGRALARCLPVAAGAYLVLVVLMTVVTALGAPDGDTVVRALARPRGALRPVADAAKHPLFHDEVRRFEAEGLCEADRDGRCPRRPPADDEARAMLVQRLDDERPGGGDLALPEAARRLRRLAWRSAADHKRARRIELDDGQLHRLLGVERDVVLADREVLPLRVDPVGAVDVEAEEVLEGVVGIEAAAVLAELHDPGERLGGRRLDGDRARGHVHGLRDQVVAGEGASHFVVARAPAPKARQQDEAVRGAESLERHGRRRDLVQALHGSSSVSISAMTAANASAITSAPTSVKCTRSIVNGPAPARAAAAKAGRRSSSRQALRAAASCATAPPISAALSSQREPSASRINGRTTTIRGARASVHTSSSS